MNYHGAIPACIERLKTSNKGYWLFFCVHRDVPLPCQLFPKERHIVDHLPHNVTSPVHCVLVSGVLRYLLSGTLLNALDAIHIVAVRIRISTRTLLHGVRESVRNRDILKSESEYVRHEDRGAVSL